jgi:hypothetical protein
MAIITNRSQVLSPVATTRTGHDLIVVGASAGGIPAISTLLRGLPADLPAAVLVVFHLAPDSGAMLPRIIGEKSPLSVSLAADRAPLRHGEGSFRQPAGSGRRESSPMRATLVSALARQAAPSKGDLVPFKQLKYASQWRRAIYWSNQA